VLATPSTPHLGTRDNTLYDNSSFTYHPWARLNAHIQVKGILAYLAQYLATLTNLSEGFRCTE
jgi:hypothetical protein